MKDTHKFHVFMARVLERDNFTCQHCYSQENLHIHHIKKRKANPELQYDVNNGITLCNKCHKKFENWEDAPWNKHICIKCQREIQFDEKQPIPFNILWDGIKKWYKVDVADKCKNK